MIFLLLILGQTCGVRHVEHDHVDRLEVNHVQTKTRDAKCQLHVPPHTRTVKESSMFTESINVEYRSIPEFPGYRAGSDGSIWTCRRTSSGRTDTWRPLAGEVRKTKSKLGNAYKYYLLQLPGGGRRAVACHHLVLLAFVGPRPDGMCACHANDNGLDNRPENLRWATMADNISDRGRNKRTAQGERSGASKLTNDQARQVIALIRAGKTNSEIASGLSVGANAIWSIRSGTSWRWLWDDGFVLIPSKRGTAARRSYRTSYDREMVEREELPEAQRRRL